MTLNDDANISKQELSLFETVARKRERLQRDHKTLPAVARLRIQHQ